ncbi:hypothetical protein B0T18DRAFT_412566 [Schizothecium vesticola]|uniref:CFEM domain-containing protein n=1 Tax=Schizothecium vesticola TaxID=314040 RepID=A0AA40K5M2_9PEZI|nr:hypothetical protein B0T18DRAFT_412566 [Schizothecium vesticola]
MKVFASLVTLALAAGAVAQAIPPCAQSCADPFLTNGIGGCGLDPGCICGDKSFIDGISCCVLDKCEAADQTSAVVFASVFCSANGVTTLPTTVGCATTGATGLPTTGTAAKTTSSSAPPPTGAAVGTTASLSTNYGPRQTAAGLGAIGGIVAAVAML